jgi:anti-sigma B factor antagonist
MSDGGRQAIRMWCEASNHIEDGIGRRSQVASQNMTHSLHISVENGKEVVVMHLQGRIDIESSPQLRHHLLAHLRKQSPPGTIDVNLAAVNYMDTSGVATLVEGLKMARLGGIAMHLQGLQGRLLHLFQSTGIGSLFDTSGSANNPSATRVP